MTQATDAPGHVRSARVIVEVRASMIPNQADRDFTRRWAITGDEWDEACQAQRQGEVLAELNGKAQGYANLLMLQPDRLNWVQTVWLWL